MYFFTCFTFILFISTALTSESITKEQEDDFKEYLEKFNITLEEEKFNSSLSTYLENIRKIEEHNEKYKKKEVTWEKGINQFTYMSKDEFVNKFNSTLKQNDKLNISSILINLEIDLDFPGNKIDWSTLKEENETKVETFDSRNSGCVPPVQDQADCGLCYTFATISTIEINHCYTHNKTNLYNHKLSEQYVVDCIEGLECYRNVFNLMGLIENGNYLVWSSDVRPYDGTKKNCPTNVKKRVKIIKNHRANGYKKEKLFKYYLKKYGALQCSISGKMTDLSDYKKGIISEVGNGNDFAHAVTMVGYGEENGTEYWLIRNSWGKDWGEDGYFKLAFGKNIFNITLFDPHFYETELIP